MSIAYVAVTLLAAAANTWAASNDIRKPPWIIDNMNRVGVTELQLPGLAALKVAGALGLLVGLAIPAIGVAAGIGLTLFFLGAIAAHLRAHWYDLGFAVGFLALAIGALGFRLVTL